LRSETVYGITREMDRNVTPLQPPPRVPVTAPVVARDRKWFWLSIGFVVGLVTGILIFWLFSALGSEEVPPVVTATPSSLPTATSTPRPSPSASPTVNPADWTIEVLNGSGVGGAAAKAAQVLRERGYTVSRVGNAEESDLEKTQLLVSSDRSEAAAALVADLQEAGFPVTEFDATLDSESVTARLTIGQDWEAPSTSPTTSPTPTPKTSPTS